MTGQLRVGIVGLGVIARYYRAALSGSPGAILAAVCDRNPRALLGAEVPAFTDHRALIGSGAVDALVVTAPNDAHAGICRAALAAGLPVCVEKPLAHRLAAGEELAALAGQRDTVLFTAFHRRYNAAVRRLADRLAGAAPIVSMRLRYWERIEEHAGPDRWYLDPERTGGGCVADNGPNAFDLARFLVGDLHVRDAVRGDDGAGPERHAVVRLSAASGAAVRVELDWSYPGERKDIEVRLADGTLLGADMLAGHDGFKASLWHEYEALLAEFVGACAGAGYDRAAGIAALRLVAATYRAGSPAMPVAGEG